MRLWDAGLQWPRTRHTIPRHISPVLEQGRSALVNKRMVNNTPAG